jgi:hypothetical protein
MVEERKRHVSSSINSCDSDVVFEISSILNFWGNVT